MCWFNLDGHLIAVYQMTLEHSTVAAAMVFSGPALRLASPSQALQFQSRTQTVTRQGSVPVPPFIQMIPAPYLQQMGKPCRPLPGPSSGQCDALKFRRAAAKGAQNGPCASLRVSPEVTPRDAAVAPRRRPAERCLLAWAIWFTLMVMIVQT